MKVVLYQPKKDHWLHQFVDDFPQLSWSVATSPEAAAPYFRDAEIVVLTNRACSPQLGDALRSHAGPSLRWIHFTTAGIDSGIAMGLPESAVVTNAAGVKANMVAEHALALLLALTRRLPAIATAQRAHQWRRDEISDSMATLEGATVCIVGLGAIGRDIARKVRAFDARPIAVSRAAPANGDVDAVFPRERMNEALGQADVLVISTTADDSSRHLIGNRELAALKKGAVVVNIARGSIIDELALIDALKTGHLGGAGLDVMQTEPLPAESPLWNLPNVIVSPHSAGSGSSGYLQHKRLFADNLERFAAGEPLANQCKIPIKA